jgi:hypothetical protein
VDAHAGYPLTPSMTTPTSGALNLFARPKAKMMPTNLFTTQRA